MLQPLQNCLQEEGKGKTPAAPEPVGIYGTGDAPRAWQYAEHEDSRALSLGAAEVNRKTTVDISAGRWVCCLLFARTFLSFSCLFLLFFFWIWLGKAVVGIWLTLEERDALIVGW